MNRPGFNAGVDISEVATIDTSEVAAVGTCEVAAVGTWEVASDVMEVVDKRITLA